MRKTNTKAVAIALGFLVVASLFALPATANLNATIDSETTVTADQSALQDGDTIPNFNGSDNQTRKHQFVVDNGTVPDYAIRSNDNDTVYYTNTSTTNITEGDDGTHFNASFEESDLADVERAIDENVTLSVRAHQETNGSNESFFTLYIENDNETTVQNIDDTDVSDEDIVETTDEDGFLGVLAEDESIVETDDRNVSGDSTDVTVVFSNGTVSDDFDSAVSDASDEDRLTSLLSFSNQWTGVLVSGDDTTKAVPVFYEEAPSGFDEDQTHAIYSEDIGGETGITVKLGDDFEDADEVSVTALGGVDFTQFVTNYRGSLVPLVGMLSGLAPAAPAGTAPAAGSVPLLGLGAAAARRRGGA